MKKNIILFSLLLGFVYTSMGQSANKKSSSESSSKTTSKLFTFDKNKVTYYGGLKRIPIKAVDFTNFHISDWESFGLGSLEGRVLVPLSDNKSSSTTAISIGANYDLLEKIQGVAEINLSFSDISILQVLLGLDYLLYEKNKFRFHASPRIGYTSATANFGEIEVLPGKTPPVILPEGTFNQGDDLRMSLSSTTVNLGFTANYTFNEKIGIYANTYFAFSFQRDAVLTSNGTEVPFDSNGVVKDDGSSTQAGIEPNAKVQGIGFAIGITHTAW